MWTATFLNPPLKSDEQNVRNNLFQNLRRKTCIQCESRDLELFFAIEQEVQPPEYSHAIITVCPDCRGGQLERAYYDEPESDEVFQQTEWFLLDESSMVLLREFIRQSEFGPCLEPLSPQCLCTVHWRLAEAAKRLEPLSDDEMQRLGGAVAARFGSDKAGFPRFERLL